MTALRHLLVLAITALCMLVFASTVAAATPQQIYKDLADNGKLDRRYSEADLASAFSLRRVIGTDQPATPTRRPASAEIVQRAEPAASSSRKIPFSGLDLALLVVGGGPLLLIGVGLRRRIAPPAPQAEVVRS